MAKNEFDQVVIGGGLAGLCCAGELVAEGQRPLLICEGSEVGGLFAVKTLGERNRAFMQTPIWQLGWGGGWWYGMARKLNIPLRLYPGIKVAATTRGGGPVKTLPVCSSAAALTDLLMELFPAPFDEATRRQLDKVLGDALSIPYEELCEMNQVLLATWLADHGADELVSTLLLTVAGFTHDMPLEAARRHLSAFGGIGILRLLLCGEALTLIIYPNPREGLCIPLAQQIERRGGAVWRGRRVARVLTDAGRVTGVRLADGTEIEAATVALATGNARVASLLDPLPPEVVEAVDFATSISMIDFNLFFLLDRTVVQPEDTATAVFDVETMSIYHWVFSLTGVAPWTTEPGKQLAGCHMSFTTEEVEAAGGEEAIYARMTERSIEIYPDLKEAIVDTATHSTFRGANTWMGPVVVGPKLPRTVESVDGLWFVGDGSEPCRGIWSEAASSCGILGARAMLGQ